MSSRAMRNALDWVRLTIRESEVAALSDAQLLTAFLQSRDEASFATIIRRHGPMVLGVCKRFLRDHHDAEDAFQAVFLVFMKRADSIRPQGQLANWLYGVAFKTACKTRSYLGKRRLREWSVASVPETGQPEVQEWCDFWLLLDQELNQLAPKYRAPIVLCDLEGKSRREAAHALGLLDGTLSGRLARARRQLAARLSRRGVSLSGAAVAAALLNETASASLPAGLAAATTKTVFVLACKGTLLASPATLGIISITKGVMRSMFIAKVWQTSAVLVVSTLAVGAGAGVLTVRGGNLGGAFGQVATGDDPTGTVQQPDKTKMDRAELLEYRRQAARAAQVAYGRELLPKRKAEWETRWKEYQAGRGSQDFLLQSSTELMDAELVLANSVVERIAARRAQTARVLQFLEIIRKRFDAGKVAVQDLAEATGTYELARSQLSLELNDERAAKAAGDAIGKSKKLIDELVAAANEECQARLNEYTAGRGTQAFLFASSKRLRDAELKKASGPESQVAATTAHFNRVSAIYNIAKERFDAGKIPTQDLQEANYFRIEAELDLEAAKNRGAAFGFSGFANHADPATVASEAQFRRLDLNGDGVLNLEEMPEALRAEKDKWDTNKDGFIDFKEFQAYLRSRMKQNPGKPGDSKGPVGR